MRMNTVRIRARTKLKNALRYLQHLRGQPEVLQDLDAIKAGHAAHSEGVRRKYAKRRARAKMQKASRRRNR